MIGDARKSCVSLQQPREILGPQAATPDRVTGRSLSYTDFVGDSSQRVGRGIVDASLQGTDLPTTLMMDPRVDGFLAYRETTIGKLRVAFPN